MVQTRQGLRGPTGARIQQREIVGWLEVIRAYTYNLLNLWKNLKLR